MDLGVLFEGYMCTIPYGSLQFGAKIGQGSNGVVFDAMFVPNDSVVNQRVCVKVLWSHRRKRDIEELVGAHIILMNLRHPNIACLLDINMADGMLIVVMGEIHGPSFVDVMAYNRRIYRSDETESRMAVGSVDDCKRYMQGLLRGVRHLHANRIVHCDVKLDNIKLSSLDFSTAEAILIDFDDIAIVDGSGPTVFSKDLLLEGSTYPPMQYGTYSLRGTMHYLSPETLTGQWDYKRDIWSAGVCMYLMVGGHFPFKLTHPNGNRKTWPEMYTEFHKPLDFTDAVWRRNPAAVSLVDLMLHCDPALRPTADQCLHHPFFDPQGEWMRPSYSSSTIDSVGF
eukprot:Platyproteum_vivax@DN2907_c0_g1_i1.p1